MVFAIFLGIFLGKGIYPFGKNSLIWGDMHDQVTAFYYHFYDIFHGDASFLVTFQAGGGINFIGILAYYIMSPVNFLLLLFPRDDLYLAASLLIACKVWLSSLTALYFIRSYFKKLPSALAIFLALSYAFSGYVLCMYQITSWMDAVYLFPLVVIGLKKVLDLEKPQMYLFFLTMSLICSFYVSFMIIIFIFLSSYLYLLVYHDKEHRKKAMLSLGISTIFSILLSLFVVVPAFHQISQSSRFASNFQTLLNSKAGPLTDKLALVILGGIFYFGLLLLLKNWKKEKNFCVWYVATCLIAFIPLVIEPINKLWHFGSYAFFPYRFGFITIFLLMLGACYGFSKEKEEKKEETNKKKVGALVVSVVSSLLIAFSVFVKYDSFQKAYFRLTISSDHLLLLVLFATTLFAVLGYGLVYRMTDGWKKTRILAIGLITITQLGATAYLYFGIDFAQEMLTSQYENMTALAKTYPKGEIYRLKNDMPTYMMNTGPIMKYATLDHFTSLTPQLNIETLRRLGYSSFWVKTYGKGGTLFSDAILGTGYLITNPKEEKEYYQYVENFQNVEFYKIKQKPAFGYFIQTNPSIEKSNNSFEIQNKMYQSILGKKETLFEIHEDWIKNNLQKDEENYEIIDKEAFNSLEQTLQIGKKQVVYLEILKDLNNLVNEETFEAFHIYVNDQLFRENGLKENDNGVINLGTYENTEVNIKIEFLKDISLHNLTLATMENERYEEFISKTQAEREIRFHRNQIVVKMNSEEKQTFFLPMFYDEGYQLKVNGKEQPIKKVFSSFLGAEVEKGENEIVFTYVPPKLKETALISFLSLIALIVMLRCNWYDKLCDWKLGQKVASFLYHLLFFLVVGIGYIGFTLIFILSFFHHF